MKKILCYRNSKLGDYLISIPSIKLIRKKHGKCKIYYLTVKTNFYNQLPKYLEDNLIVDEFIYFDNTITDKFKLINILKSKKFDSFYYLQEKTNFYREFRDYFYFLFLKNTKKYGFFSKKYNYSNFNETLQIAKRIDKEITVHSILKLIKIKKKIDKPIYNFNYISISIGGFSQPKIWNLRNWSILLRLILGKKNYKIIITGTKEDFKKGNTLSLINKKRILCLCGKNSLNDLLNIIRFSKFHITNDNGSMHVASLFSKKSICLFNNHDLLGKWYPTNNNAIILRNKFGVNSISPLNVFKKLSMYFDTRN
tara:strand:- start:4851 stop:5780 length:930 start_codon:yes stop_codon:yes gene_type:complete